MSPDSETSKSIMFDSSLPLFTVRVAERAPANNRNSMKTKMKCLAVASSLALLASASPAFAQNTVDTTPSESAAEPQMRQSFPSDGAIMDEPAGADNTRNWSWIGLLGLAGLFGLKRHNDVRDENYRTART